MANLNVNNDKVIEFTAKLEKLNKSAFPSAVRNTLNNAAFEVKKQLPKTAESKFITRQKSFFKRFSIVDKAEGFDVNKMISKAGINSAIDSEIANNLVSQEFGGMVNGKKLIPHDNARVSGSQNKRVAAQNRLNKVNIYDGTKAYNRHKGGKKSKFVAAIMGTAKSGKKHMMLKTGSSGMVYEVTAISQNAKNKKVSFKIKKLYSVRNRKSNNVKAHGFMSATAAIVSKDIDKIYQKNAEFQFKKYLK